MSRLEEMKAQGFKAYEGQDIRVFWNPKLCTHVALCWQSNINVFNPGRRPWVDLSAAPAKEIAEIIDLCPSGALQYEWKAGEE